LSNTYIQDDDLKKASRSQWQDTFEEIRDLLMTGAELAFDKGLLGRQEKEKYFNSGNQHVATFLPIDRCPCHIDNYM